MNEAEETKDPAAKTRQAKMSAHNALPLSSAEQLVKIIKAYAVASNGGESQMNYKDVASVAGINPTIVSRNNSFLEESSILTSPKYGYYLPTEGAVRFAREAAWDEAGAKSHLRRVIADSWYGLVTIQNLSLRPILTRDELRKSLAIKCGATEGDAGSLGFLIDFILYTNLAVADETGTISRGNFDEVANNPESVPRIDRAVSLQGAGIQAKVGSATGETSKNVSLVCHVHIHDFSELTSENAATLRKWIRLLDVDANTVELSLLDPNSGKPDVHS
jgi:hypothetical protein